MTGESAGAGAGAAESPNGTAASAAPADASTAPAETKPLNAIALGKEVVLERAQSLLEWLLRRLKRYRAGRGDWWEK